MSVLTGCIDDPEFGVTPNGYIVQDNDWGTPRLSPYLYFVASNGVLADVRITKDGLPVTGTNYGDYYEVLPDEYYTDRSLFNGNYIYQATSEGKDVVNNAITFDVAEDDLHGEMNVTEFRYEPGKVIVKIETVEHATHYGIFVNPVINDMPNSRLAGRLSVETVKTSTTEQVIEVSFSSSEFNYGAVKISLVVINGNVGNGIYLHGAEKTLQKGAESFVEDESGDE